MDGITIWQLQMNSLVYTRLSDHHSITHIVYKGYPKVDYKAF